MSRPSASTTTDALRIRDHIPEPPSVNVITPSARAMTPPREPFWMMARPISAAAGQIKSRRRRHGAEPAYPRPISAMSPAAIIMAL